MAWVNQKVEREFDNFRKRAKDFCKQCETFDKEGADQLSSLVDDFSNFINTETKDVFSQFTNLKDSLNKTFFRLFEKIGKEKINNKFLTEYLYLIQNYSRFLNYLEFQITGKKRAGEGAVISDNGWISRETNSELQKFKGNLANFCSTYGNEKNKKFLDAVDANFKKIEEFISQEYKNTAQSCELVYTSTLPTKETFKQLNIKSNAAYVVYDNKIYYLTIDSCEELRKFVFINSPPDENTFKDLNIKTRSTCVINDNKMYYLTANVCIELKAVDEKKLKEFFALINIEQRKVLSKSELMQIAAFTGHAYSPKDLSVGLSTLSVVMYMQLAFAMANCEIKDSAQFLREVFDLVQSYARFADTCQWVDIELFEEQTKEELKVIKTLAKETKSEVDQAGVKNDEVEKKKEKALENQAKQEKSDEQLVNVDVLGPVPASLVSVAPDNSNLMPQQSNVIPKPLYPQQTNDVVAIQIEKAASGETDEKTPLIKKPVTSSNSSFFKRTCRKVTGAGMVTLGLAYLGLSYLSKAFDTEMKEVVHYDETGIPHQYVVPATLVLTGSAVFLSGCKRSESQAEILPVYTSAVKH